MADWIVIRKEDGGMPGLMGPYSTYRAQQVADRLDVPYEIVHTLSRDPAKAKIEMKERMAAEGGYRAGARNIKKPVMTIEELDEE